MTNLDLHVFQTRDGAWKVRIEGLPGGRVYLGESGCEASPAEVLEAASAYLRARENPAFPFRRDGQLGPSIAVDHPLWCRCRRCE